MRGRLDYFKDTIIYLFSSILVKYFSSLGLLLLILVCKQKKTSQNRDAFLDYKIEVSKIQN